MPKINIKDEQKAENFDAIAPKENRPALITTNGIAENKGINFIGKLFFILFLAAAGSTAWFYFQYSNLQKQINSVQETGLEEDQASQGLSLLDRINQHILLPHDQQPEITTIENAQELRKKETFFEYAQDGDALVKFNSLEIIYNPVADVIVNARTRGTVAGAEVRAVQGAITIDIRNGAGVAGLAGKTAESFKGLKDFIVQGVGNAAKNNYPKTILVNLSNKDITGLEKQFKTASVKDMPQGEQVSNADVVIILGKL
ncbi:MAG: LytR C-terminal domain-containing protein [Candidatus Doudnabacteria bacterium]|nr:LytR C-terminal domain-containing protein [Candidatus Doudnabacteria bacterium]